MDHWPDVPLCDLVIHCKKDVKGRSPTQVVMVTMTNSADTPKNHFNPAFKIINLQTEVNCFKCEI